MKSLFLLFFLLCITSRLSAQTALKAADAIKYIGKNVTICDTIRGVKYLDEHTRYLFLGVAYPDQQLTVIQRIKKIKATRFPVKVHNDDMSNLEACITGLVRIQNGKPVIYLNGKIHVYSNRVLK